MNASSVCADLRDAELHLVAAKRTALVVDDIRSFTAPELDVDNVLLARTSGDAIGVLQRVVITDLVLDFDLAWNNPDRSDTGLRVVAFLCARRARYRSVRVEIITDLDDVALQMSDLLRSAGFHVTVSDRGHRWNDTHR